jgi:ATP-dependent helicase HrpA
LKPRVQVTGPENKPLAASRDLKSLKAKLRDADQKVEVNAWDAAAAKFERYQIESWDFGDLPAQIEVPSQSGMPLPAYPGLQVEGGDVSLRLFRNREQAVQSSHAGMIRLGELALGRELAWLQKDLRALNSVKDLYITMGPGDELLESAYIGIRQYLFSHDNIYPLSKAAFDQLVSTAKKRLPGFLHTFTTLTNEILKRRQEILLAKKPYPGMRQDLDRLVTPRFLATVPWPRLQNFPRYLKALQVRAERWATNPVKDQEKARQILPYQQRLAALVTRKDLSIEKFQAREEFRWLIEELKVSLYAQELGTSLPISPKRLDRFIEEHRL